MILVGVGPGQVRWVGPGKPLSMPEGRAGKWEGAPEGAREGHCQARQGPQCPYPLTRPSAITPFEVLGLSRSLPGVGAGTVSRTYLQGERSLRAALAAGQVRAPFQFPEAPLGAQRQALGRHHWVPVHYSSPMPSATWASALRPCPLNVPAPGIQAEASWRPRMRGPVVAGRHLVGFTKVSGPGRAVEGWGGPL